MNYTPVCLSATVSLLPGGSVTPDLGLLQHPFRRAMYIDEIRFWIDLPATASGVSLPRHLGGSIRVRFNLGRAVLNALPVPVWNFDEAHRYAFVETLPDVSTGQHLARSYYKWQLSKPLLVPSGAVLAPVFSRDLVDAWSLANPSHAVPVTIAYAGRALPQNARLPRETPVPFVGIFIDNPDRQTSDIGETESGEHHLYNPTLKTLTVERFVGRLRVVFNGGDSNISEYDLYTATKLTSTAPAFTVAMKNSKGEDLVPNFLPFTDVFDQQTRSWRYSGYLPPRERFLARIRDRLVTTGTFYQPMISMIGFRSEPLSVL